MKYRVEKTNILIASILFLSALCSQQHTPTKITYLHADGIGSIGSTAYHIKEKELDIYIEAFPAKGMDLDPAGITDADIIICSNHGHKTHYDAHTVAMVQKNSGAHVVGNRKVESDMTDLGIARDKILVLSGKNPGDMETLTVMGVRITAVLLRHSYVDSILLNTFLIELPSGTRIFHGTCVSASSVEEYLTDKPEFYDLDVMMLDYEHDFEAIHLEFHPKHLIKHHESSGATWWADYPSSPKILHHGEFFFVKNKKEMS